MDRAEIEGRVEGWLEQLGAPARRTPEGLYGLHFGSTAVLVSVFDDEGTGLVRIVALVLARARVSTELLAKLVRLNASVALGAFQLFEDGALGFSYTLSAAELDYASFAHALRYVARVADDHDEEIQALAGGERVEDLLSRVGGSSG
jgi:hypothetical protein